MAELDLDQTWVHWDFNIKKVEKLLKDYPNTVEAAVEGPPHVLLRRSKKLRGMVSNSSHSIHYLLKKYEIESLMAYTERSRMGLNLLRVENKAIPKPP